ncbi:MAG: hypothetical protein IPL73_05995 [Candidatus Obscuribacter sp.]|nr:hypothetical protein [Candidatus Obscuribacter sp.]
MTRLQNPPTIKHNLSHQSNLGIVSAAQDAYQPQCGRQTEDSWCSMPGNRAQELLFDDIF